MSNLFSLDLSQWDCIRPNLGEWHGSFTEFSSTGDWVKETPSRLTLVEDRPGEHMQLTLVRTPANAAPKTNRLEFGAPGPAPYVVFCPSGAFSQGPMQRRHLADFGAELALNMGDRRLRTVQMYGSDFSGNSTLRYVTLIRECRTAPAAATSTLPAGNIADWAGEWIGEAVYQSADMTKRVHGQSRYQLYPSPQDNTIWQSHSEIVTSAGLPLLTDTQILVQTAGQRLNNDHWQILLLPGGVLCALPHTLGDGQGFTLEVAWQWQPHHRQRLIRCYDAGGNWAGLLFVAESRQS